MGVENCKSARLFDSKTRPPTIGHSPCLGITCHANRPSPWHFSPLPLFMLYFYCAPSKPAAWQQRRRSNIYAAHDELNAAVRPPPQSSDPLAMSAGQFQPFSISFFIFISNVEFFIFVVVQALIDTRKVTVAGSELVILIVHESYYSLS